MSEQRSPLHVLVAYPYADKHVIATLQRRSADVRVLLDSGAFTAWKAGTAIQVDDYCRFLETLPFTPWRYFTLDVIGDPAGTLRNYETMRRRGFNPVPIFTRGEDVSVLEDYYRTSDLVAVGGLVGTQGNRGFVNGIMQRIGRRPVHWLGFTSLPFLKHYRPYSCDSSAWEGGARYGTLTLYMGQGRTKLMKKADFANRPTPDVLRAIQSYGYSPRDFARDASWAGGNSFSRRLSAQSYVRLSMDVGRKLDVKFFLAFAAKQALDIVLMGLDRERGQR